MKTNRRSTVAVLGIFLLGILRVSTMRGEDHDPKLSRREQVNDWLPYRRRISSGIGFSDRGRFRQLGQGLLFLLHSFSEQRKSGINCRFFCLWKKLRT